MRNRKRRDRYSGISLETLRAFRAVLSRKADGRVAAAGPRGEALKKVSQEAASQGLAIRRARVGV